jgi:hypothetical protein
VVQTLDPSRRHAVRVERNNAKNLAFLVLKILITRNVSASDKITPLAVSDVINSGGDQMLDEIVEDDR